MPQDDLTGLGNTAGYFWRKRKMLSCGREAWEIVSGNRTEVLTLTRERRREVVLWLDGGGPQPSWWPGWPGE